MAKQTSVMDRPPILYEPNNYGGGTSSPEDVIRDAELAEARRILDKLGLIGVTLGDHDYLITGFNHLGLRRMDADAEDGPWDVDA